MSEHVTGDADRDRASIALPDLPTELIMHIIQYLTAREAVDFSITTRHFHNLLSDYLWTIDIGKSASQHGPLWWAVTRRDNCDPVTTRVARKAISLGAHVDAQLLEEGPECNDDKDHNTPLLQSLKPLRHRKNGGEINVDMIKLLLASGADPCKASQSASALELAVQDNNLEVLELLLSAPARSVPGLGKKSEVLTDNLRSQRANIRSHKGQRLLGIAAQFADEQVMRLLLDAGAEVVDPSDKIVQHTPLYAAIDAGKLENVKMLADGGAQMLAFKDQRRLGCWPVVLEYISKHVKYDRKSLDIINPEVLDILRYLVGKCQRPVIPEDTFFDGKCRTTCLDIPRAKVYHQILSPSIGIRPIPAALELLFDGGLQVDFDSGAKAIWDYVAISNKHHPKTHPTMALDYVRLLLSRGANPDYMHPKDHMTPVMMAARNASIDMLELFLSYGADITVRDGKGMPLLKYAFYTIHQKRRSYKTVRALLEYHREADGTISAEMRQQLLIKEDLEADIYGFSALHRAIAEGWTEIAQLLIRSDAELLMKSDAHVQSCSTSGGNTALHLACGNSKSASLVPLLLERKVDLEAKNRFGSTPLLVAAQFGNQTLVHVLIKAGAKTDAVDSEGRTCLAHATEKGWGDVVKVLSELGASQ